MSEWLHQFISTVKKDKKRSLLIMVLAGVLILVIAWPVSEKNTSDADAGADGGYSAEASGGTAGDASGDDALKNEKSSDKTGAGPGALSDGQTLEAYVSDAQERLTKLLSSIEGAGQIQVMITAHATRERVVGKDVTKDVSTVQESDGSGGTRITGETSYSESTLYEAADSGQAEGSPYIIKELVPEIEGVVVSAQGADDEYVVDEITQAVSVLFDLPVHKIKVVKMES